MTTKGRHAYELRRDSQGRMKWTEIAEQVGATAVSACSLAARYAEREGLKWPLNRPKRDNAGRKGYREIACERCGKAAWKQIGTIGRNKRAGKPLLCSKRCADALRRSHKTPEQRKAEKTAYDRARREANREEINRKKRAAYYANHEENLRKAAELRAQIRADPERHAQFKELARYYASRPEWKAKKKRYDREYRAVKRFGPEWGPVMVALLDLEDAIEKKASRYERMIASGYYNKKQQRRRDHDARKKEEADR